MDGASPDQAVNGVLQDLGLRMAKSGDARLPAAFMSIVTGVHDLVAQLKPTGEELRAMIDSLPRSATAPMRGVRNGCCWPM